MMSSSEGAKFLSTEDLLLKQLTKSFAQLDPVRIVIFGLVFLKKAQIGLSQFNGTPSKDPIFSEPRFCNTLTFGYLEMLGVLSTFEKGVECVSTSTLLFVCLNIFPDLWKSSKYSQPFTTSVN